MKKSFRENLNLFFSAFLVIVYIICSYFFLNLASRTPDTASNVIQVLVFLVFGLLVFYATRVGEGKVVKRFSPIILCVLDIPALYIIIASIAPALPLYTQLSSQPVVMILACIALGYGIPYTFVSGFELIEEKEEEDAVVEGGIVEELAEAEDLSDDEVASKEDVEELKTLDYAEDLKEASKEAEAE